MAKKEIRLSYDDIKDPQTITQCNIKAFKEQGLDIHKHEVTELVDDHSTRTRILKVRAPRVFIDLGRKSHR